MAIKDFISLADDKLHEVFSRKPHDPTKARAAMTKRLDKAHEQFSATEPTKGKKLFKIQNGVVLLTLPFEVAGKSEFHLPSEHFADAIKHLKDSITKGELDNEIAAGTSSVGGGRKKTVKSSGTGAGWSEERLAKFKKTIAARKAAN